MLNHLIKYSLDKVTFYCAY